MIEKEGLVTLEQKQCLEYHLNLPNDSISQVLYFDVEIRDSLSSIKNRVNKLFKNNSSLRLSFCKKQGTWYQCINTFEADNDYYTYIDIQLDCNKEEIIQEYISETEKNMDIRKTNNLTRFVIFHTNNKEFRCVLLLHHIICDEWSINLLRNQFLHDHNIKCNDYDIIDYAIKQNDYVSYIMKDIQEHYNNLCNNLKKNNQQYIPLLNDRLYDLSSFESRIIQRKTSLYRTSLDINLENKKNLIAIIYATYYLVAKYFYRKKDLLFAAPIRNLIGKNKKLVGYLDSGVYTYINNRYEKVDSLISDIYLEILNSMKYSVPDHSYFKLDSRLLRRMTMLYINIMPQYYDVSINKSDYNNIFSHDNSYPYYPLSIFIIEKEDNIYFEYSYSEEFYSKTEIKLIHKNFQDMVHIFVNNK